MRTRRDSWPRRWFVALLAIGLAAFVRAAAASSGPFVEGSLRVSPNPTIGTARIQFGLTRDVLVQMCVLDSGGHVVAAPRPLALRVGPQVLSWGADELAAKGLYVLRLRAEGVTIGTIILVR